MKRVYRNRHSDKEVSIKAEGKVKDFKNGTPADNYGWNNVTSYAGRVHIDRYSWKRTLDQKFKRSQFKERITVRSGDISNRYLNAQAGHILASQNGGDGSQALNVFAQDGGVNNGSWRSRFENPMRDALDKSHDLDSVSFRVGLHGKRKLKRGSLEKISPKLKATHKSIFDSSSESSDESD